MIRITFTILLLIVTINTSTAQNKPAYQLYNSAGELAIYDEMVADLAQSDMVFFGEYHDNPISHWLQLEMSKSFYEIKGDSLFLGAEMFETEVIALSSLSFRRVSVSSSLNTSSKSVALLYAFVNQRR